MRFDVAILHPDGAAEVVAKGLEADRADAYRRHPSMSGHRVIVVPSFQGVVVN